MGCRIKSPADLVFPFSQAFTKRTWSTIVIRGMNEAGQEAQIGVEQKNRAMWRYLDGKRRPQGRGDSIVRGESQPVGSNHGKAWWIGALPQGKQAIQDDVMGAEIPETQSGSDGLARPEDCLIHLQFKPQIF